MPHASKLTISKTMAAVVCHGPEDYRLEEVPVPTPGPGEVLLRVNVGRHLRQRSQMLSAARRSSGATARRRAMPSRR